MGVDAAAIRDSITVACYGLAGLAAGVLATVAVGRARGKS